MKEPKIVQVFLEEKMIKKLKLLALKTEKSVSKIIREIVEREIK